ncbi:Ctr copper transporter [Melampsora americana]|nr:Ctr copper transporter [Melampsora americana]
MTSFSASLPMTPLWFAGWQPKTAGTTFAACLGLFGLAILSKLLGALRHQAHLAWSKLQWEELNTNDQSLDKSDKPDTVTESLKKGCRRTGPWTAEHDIPRGILAALHSGLDYFLMLAVMTFNVYFFIAIILGLFSGEVGFGRWSASSGH